MKRQLTILAAISVLAVAAVAVFLVVRQQDVVRLRRGLTHIRAGMSTADVRSLLGQPTFEEKPISSIFVPHDIICRQRSVFAYIYQSRYADTLVISFDEDQRVRCVETITAFRVIHT